jgi:biotin operon repressor
MTDQVKDARRHGYFRVDNIIMDKYASEMGVAAFAVYALLCRCADAHTGQSFPSFKHIAKKLKIGRTTVARSIETLIEYGLITREKRHDANGEPLVNLYTILHVESVQSGQGSTATGLRVVPPQDYNKTHLEQD